MIKQRRFLGAEIHDWSGKLLMLIANGIPTILFINGLDSIAVRNRFSMIPCYTQRTIIIVVEGSRREVVVASG
jgi:hypothetical protein